VSRAGATAGGPGGVAEDALGSATLADVLPAIAAALGAPVRAEEPGGSRLEFEPARSAVLILLDGLGARLLARRIGHAPFLRSLREQPGSGVISCTFPSTTATSLASLGTGLLPGTHGLVGLDVLDPDRGVVFNELAWDPEVDPRRWQPRRTVFEDLEALGVEVIRVGPAFFDGSGLTEAALRGGRFTAAAALEERCEATRAALAALGPRGRGLVYLYWGDIDKVGHVHGCDSWQWGEEVEAVDYALGRLVRRLDRDTLVVITADHGMVDVPFADRIDLAYDSRLAAGVDQLGGEPRALHLYCRPGATVDVLQAWRERLGERFDLRTRDEAVAAGWFGPVEPRVLPRIGDVVGSARGAFAVVDSRTTRPEILVLLGLHGARSAAEQLVPLLVTRGQAPAR